MRVGIIDADLLDHGTRHPNLALMKISGWLKGIRRMGNELFDPINYNPAVNSPCVHLVMPEDLAGKSLSELMDPRQEDHFDKFIISMVFDFSHLPEPFIKPWEDDLSKPHSKRLFTEGDDKHPKWYSDVKHRIIFGGTGFIPYLSYRNKSRKSRLPNNLPGNIEHAFPDYHLYDEFVKAQIQKGIWDEKHYRDYRDYSIGFLTRGCFRHCAFCVNREYKGVMPHSPLIEFFDPDRRFIYLWDDNFLGLVDHRDEGCDNGYNPTWNDLVQQLRSSGRPFQFRQGLDIRLMTDQIAHELATCKYHGDYIFAFDNYEQKRQIVRGLLCWKQQQPNRMCKFYVFCGFQFKGRELDDIYDTLKRIRILMHMGCLPYIMRHLNYKGSPFSGLYTQLARWCNQPQFFKKKSFHEFIIANELFYQRTSKCKRAPKEEIRHSASFEALANFLHYKKHTVDKKSAIQLAREFFNLKWDALHNEWQQGHFGEEELNDLITLQSKVDVERKCLCQN